MTYCSCHSICNSWWSLCTFLFAKLYDSLFYRHDIYLSFEESIFGAKRDIDVLFLETCDYCVGTGAKSRSCVISCNRCGGRGAVVETQKTPFGVMSQVIFLNYQYNEQSVYVYQWTVQLYVTSLFLLKHIYIHTLFSSS